jgi:hypothetical protein
MAGGAHRGSDTSNVTTADSAGNGLHVRASCYFDPICSGQALMRTVRFQKLADDQ